MESDKTNITQDILKANGFEYDDEGFLLYKKHHANPDFDSDCTISLSNRTRRTPYLNSKSTIGPIMSNCTLNSSANS